MTPVEEDPQSPVGGDRGPRESTSTDHDSDPSIVIRGSIYEPRSDSEKWATDPSQANRDAVCAKKIIGGVHRTDGRAFDFRAFCEAWGHRPCAERKAKGILRGFGRGAKDLDVVWVTWFGDDGAAIDRLRQRRVGKATEWVQIRRSEGRVWYFSSQPLPGRKEPTRWFPMEPNKALIVMRSAALVLPGVKRAAASPGWHATRNGSSSSDAQTFGVLDAERWNAALAHVVEYLKVHHDVTWDPSTPLPNGVPVSLEIELMRVLLTSPGS